MGSKGKGFIFSSDRFGFPLDPETATPQELGEWLANFGVLEGSIRPDQRAQVAGNLADLNSKFSSAMSEARARFEIEGGDLEMMLEEAAHRVIGELKGLTGDRIKASWEKKQQERHDFGRALPGLRLYAETLVGRFHELKEEERREVVFVLPDNLPNPAGAEFVLRYSEAEFKNGGRASEGIFEGLVDLEATLKLLILMIDLRSEPEETFANEEVIRGFISGVSNLIHKVPCLQEQIVAGLQIRVWCLLPKAVKWKCSQAPLDEIFSRLG